MRRIGDGLVRAYLGLVLLFLYLPIAIMMAMAFNRSQLYELPIQFDTVWFAALLQNPHVAGASGTDQVPRRHQRHPEEEAGERRGDADAADAERRQ